MKPKLYTEEKIFEIINKWAKNSGYTSPDSFYDEVEKLKRKFMTAQGFRRALDKAGLVGTKFPVTKSTRKEKL